PKPARHARNIIEPIATSSNAASTRFSLTRNVLPSWLSTLTTPSGQTGGQIEALHPDALTKLNALCAQDFGPAWIGINPINGKAQALWMIDSSNSLSVMYFPVNSSWALIFSSAGIMPSDRIEPRTSRIESANPT